MDTKRSSIDFIRRALMNAKGDDLERALRAFHGMTPQQMSEQHGASGKTRQQILDEYREHRAEWHSAMDLLENVLAKA